jgi:hypothetical protein
MKQREKKKQKFLLFTFLLPLFENETKREKEA